MKTISCVIPVYNLAHVDNLRRFKKLIDSLCRAATNLRSSSFEVVIINDDPRHDISENIGRCLKTCAAFEIWRIISNPENKGQAYSRNAGAEAANGEYIHFIDQDDYVNDLFYSEWEKAPERDVFIANAFFCLEKSNRVIKAVKPLARALYRNAKTLSGLWPLLVSNMAYSPGQVIMKKAVFLDAGKFTVLENRGSDDYALFYKMAMYERVEYAYSENAVFYYRIHREQNSRSSDMDKSVREFFEGIEPKTFKERLIKKMKTSSFYSPFAKIMYVTLFKRARENV